MNAAMNTGTELRVAAWPGLTPRLLRTETGTEDVAEYRSAEGYQPLDDPDALLDRVEQAGLVGRGGAAFPMAVKLRTVRGVRGLGRDRVVVANGEEGEPASVKDRWLLRNRPHLVLDGLRLAARLVGAPHAHVYVSDLASARAVETALADAGTRDPRRPDGQCPHSRTRLRGRRGDRRGARHQRRPGQTHRQAAAALRTGRGRAADPDQQRRDAGQPALHPPARRADLPRSGNGGVGGNLPGDRHRRRWYRRASTRFLSGCRSPNCLRCTGFRRRRCAVC